MEVRTGIIITGLFFFGMGIILMIWWSAPIRLVFLNPEFTSSHDYTPEIITLIAPPMLATLFGALLYILHSNPPRRKGWKIIAIAMIIGGLFSLVLQALYPIYISFISGYVLQIFPGTAMVFMGTIILLYQPFVTPQEAETNPIVH